MSDIDIDALRDVEQSIGLRRPAFGRNFVQMDRWLIADSVALSKIALRKWRSLELLPLNSLDHWLELPRLDITRHSWLAARRNGGQSRLPLLCSALYQARRARRAFYLARRLTIKLLPPGQAPEWFRTDVEARALVASVGSVNVPSIMASGELNDRAFIVEQLILGHHPESKHEQRILDILLPAVWTNYRAIGFGTAEAFPNLPVQTIQEELARVQIPEQMTYERECRDELVRRLKSLPNTNEHPLVTAFGHGDLSVGNIVVTGSGDLFVIDWETAGQMPVIWDLRKLMSSVPGLLAKSIELLRAEIKRLGWHDVMSADNQFLLGLAARVAERSCEAHQAAALPDPIQLRHTLRELRRVGHCFRTVLH